MAANNSTLQIEVVSKGIDETVRRLDSLGNAAGRNETKVKLLTDSLGLLMTAQDSAVSKASQHAMLMNAIAQQMGQASAAAKEISKSVGKLTADLDLLSSSSDRASNAFQRKSSAGNVVNATLRAMTTAALAYLGLNFAKGIVEASDGYAMMQAKLKLATGSMEKAKEVQADLFDVSQRLRVPLDDIAKLYTRMAIPMQRMGKDAKQTSEQVEYVALALKLNGATAGEASSVMLQYSQSVNAGRLNGAEFNAVAEGAPLILRAIEEELKATSKWTEYSGKSLKKMGADGEITFDLMNRAAQRALPQMREDFLALPLTVDGAMQRVKNAWLKAMGEMGEDTGLGTKLAAAIRVVEDGIPKIRDALAGAFIFIYENFSKLVLAFEILIAVKLVTWLGSVATAMTAAAMAATATAVGVGVAEGAILGFGRAIALLAGPVGIFIALVGVGLVQAYRAYTDIAPAAEKAVTDSTAKNTDARIKMIQVEIDKLEERNGKAKVVVPTVSQSGTDTLDKQFDRVQMFRKKQASATTDFEKSMLGIEVDAELKRYNTLALMQGKEEQMRVATQEKIRAAKALGIHEELGLKNENLAQKAVRKIQEAREKLATVGEVLTDQEEMAIRLKVLGKNLGVETPKRDPYKELRASLKATTLELEHNIAAGEKATSSEKIRAAMDSGKNADYRGLTGVQKSTVDEDVKKNMALEQQIIIRDRASKATIDASAEEDKYNSKIQSSVLSINDEIDKTKLQIAALTQSKMAVKEQAAARLESDALMMESQALKERDRNGNVRLSDSLMAQAQATRELATAKVELGKGQDEQAALAELDKLLDPKKAMNFGAALKEAFGDVGGSIGDMTKALGIYSKEQDALDASRKHITGLTDEKKRSSGLAALDKKEEQSKLRMYGAMASGAKGFFSEHTLAYKVLAATEKGIRIAELAGTYAAFAEKSGLLAAFTGLFITAKTTEAAVDSAQTVFMLSEHAAAGAADVAITGATETAKNTLKLPGVFLSFMDWLGPWGMAAAGVAIAAVLGSGGGGGSTGSFDLKARQASQGTGTVLGDDSAKSQSIANAITGLENNSNIGLVLTSNMLSSLRSIETSMQGLAAAIFKVSGMTTGKNFGITEGKSGGGIIDSIFGGATVTTIADTGLSLNGTASDFKSGKGAQQYVDVNTQKSGGWFGSDSSSNSRSYMAASQEISTTIGRVFKEINSTISTAAVDLGANAAIIDAAMAAYVISTEVSFKGLVGDELTKALNDVFSASADDIARSIFPDLGAFQKVGEGYYQTLIRVSAGSEQAKNALQGFGVTMVGRDSLVNKTGDIAAELVRQSIMTANAGTTMSDIMRVMSGGMSDLVDGYKSLLDIQDTMRGAGLGRSISINTVRGAGGVTELQSALGNFVDSFYTDAEKQAISFTKLRAEFGRLNTAMPQTKAGFKDLVTSLMAGDAASQELAGRVMLLSSAFADAHASFETAHADAIAKAKDNLSAAYDSESQALQNIADKMKGFSDSLKTFKDTLIMGDFSTKSSSEKYATAKANYESTSALALGGDQTAIGNFEKVASEMLKLSRDVNASGVNYTADYERVLMETETLRKFTSTQVDVATASLDALKEQVKGLLDIKESVMTVTAAIEALHMAMAATPGMAIDGSHANGLSNVPFDGYVAELHKDERVLTASENREYSSGGNTIAMSNNALVEEVKALRDELCMLREEQREQTSNVIGAQYDSTERNARTVVAGTKGAMEDASYLERTKTGLV